MVGTPTFGVVADRLGPKVAVAIALVGSASMYAATAVITYLPALAAVRFLGTFFGAEGGTGKWIADATTPAHRDTVFSVAVIMLLMGFLVGAAISAATTDWFTACLAAAGTCVVIFFYVVAWPQPQHHTTATDGTPAGPVPSVMVAARRPGYLLSVAGVAAGGWLLGSATTLAGIALVDIYGQGTLTSSAMYLIGIGVVVVYQPTVGLLLGRKLGPAPLMGVTIACGGAALVVCGFLLRLDTFWPLLLCSVPVAFVTLTTALVHADLLAVAHIEAVSPALVGTLLGAQKIVHYGASAAAPIAAAAVYVESPELGFWVAGAVAVAAGAVVYVAGLLLLGPGPTAAGPGPDVGPKHAPPTTTTTGAAFRHDGLGAA